MVFRAADRDLTGADAVVVIREVVVLPEYVDPGGDVPTAQVKGIAIRKIHFLPVVTIQRVADPGRLQRSPLAVERQRQA